MDNNMIYDVVEGNPKYGFAFKSIMKDQYAVAKVVDVEWDISRYGYIKPRIKIDPIKLVGVTVTYATAHNAKFIYDNKIGIGSKIKIIRSGDVIPKIMEVQTPSTDGKPKMPSIPFEWNETGVDIIVKTETKESNMITTTKQLVNTMKTLDVKYIDEGIMTKLVEKGYTNFIKILKAKHEAIYEIIGEKMTDKIYTGLEHGLKNTQLHILMSASNYFGRGLGTKKLHVVTKKYPDIMSKTWDDEKLFKKINKLEGFQEKTTQKFVEGFTEFKKFFNKINKYINIEYLREPEDITVETNIFQNQKIVVTGFRDSAVLEFIEKNGGDISGSVSKNTSLVICIDDTEDTSKLKKAKELKIPIITKTDFINKYLKK
jgi:DNA ligase (NAD+)